MPYVIETPWFLDELTELMDRTDKVQKEDASVGESKDRNKPLAPSLTSISPHVAHFKAVTASPMSLMISSQLRHL